MRSITACVTGIAGILLCGLAYEGDILPAVESDNSLKSDHVHPNAAGYRKIAGALLRQLQASGALPRDS
jgi:lysophospholipase L1-like esterase